MIMHNLEKVRVTMTADMMPVIREILESGEFATTSEVMRDAASGWQRQRVEVAEHMETIRDRVRRSLEDPRPCLTANDAEEAMTRFVETEREVGKCETR